MCESSEDHPATEQEQNEARIQELASLITCNQQLRVIVLQAKLHLRKACYQQIVPHLSFKPKPYNRLIAP